MICRQWIGIAVRNSQRSAASHELFGRSFEGRFLSQGVFLAALTLTSPLHAQAVDCDSYARAYADAHLSGDPTDLHSVDQAMEGAVVGGAWRGQRGAHRGAVAGGALGVLDTLGNDPAGWRGLYDLAYRLCRNRQSPVTHRPSTLGDPSYRPALPPRRRPQPALPAAPLSPQRQEN